MFTDEDIEQLASLKTPKQTESSTHFAGIVPISSISLDYSFPWHDVLIPVARGYTAIQRAVADCAMIGCDTIWVICPVDLQLLVREHLGEFVYGVQSKKIPIYYVAYNEAGWKRREGTGWAILYGARMCCRVSEHMSKWLVPLKFWVSFPHGIYDSNALRVYGEDSTLVRRTDRNLFLSHADCTIRDNKMLGFTFLRSQLQALSRKYVGLQHRKYYGDTGKRIESKRKVLSQIKLGSIFEGLTVDPERDIVCELDWFSQIDTWAGYEAYMATGQKPKKPEIFTGKARNARQ